MPRTKRIFISDLHLGSHESMEPQNGHRYSLFGEQEDVDALVGFLCAVGERSDVKEVILLGDIFDLWNCPVDVTPPTFDDIVLASHNAPVIDALRALCGSEGITVIYLPGNHDMAVTAADIGRHFPDMRYGGSALRNSAFRTGRVFAAHGSAYGAFNSPDQINDPSSQLPLGYYLARFAATKHNRTGNNSRALFGYLDDALDILGPSRLAEGVCEAVREEASLEPDAPIKMQAIGAYQPSISAVEVKIRYASLYDQWITSRGAGRAFRAVMAEVGMLGPIADTLCKSADTNIVIFGHTHGWRLDKDSLFVDDRVYANTGTWCDDAKPRTYVELGKRQGKRTVQVMQWHGTEKKSERLDGAEV